MKKLVLSLALLTTILSSCSSDTTDPVTPPVDPVVGEISGDFTESKVLAYGNYTLKGLVKIPAGVTVTIEKGSTITSDKATGENGLVVLKGGKLIAEGTAAEPIVFTEKSKTPGSWAGIIMYGDAPIVNNATNAPPQTAVSEDGLSLTYGGTNEAHNGGSLKYVRVEYAGQVITQNNKEHNGFSFYSVGSGTTLENLVSYKGNDDGFEFYGGTVSLKNSISYGNADDSFDWQDGWRGENNTNWFAYQTGVGNYGVEVEAKSVNNTFWPKVTNITLKRAAGTVTESQSEIQIDAFQFKKEGNGEFSNIVIDGYVNQTTPKAVNAGAVQALDANTYNNQIKGGKVKMTNVKITNTSNIFTSGDPKTNEGTPVSFTLIATDFTPNSNWSTSTTATGATLTTGAWATVNGVNLLEKL